MAVNGHRLADAGVLDPAGHAVRLGELWAGSPAVLVWLRHFGCMFCKEQVGEFRARRSDIEERGGQLVFVGNGSPRQASHFRDKHCPDCTLLTDPDLVSYKVIGASSGLLRTWGPQAWAPAIRAIGHGARQTAIQGRVHQQGGVLVVAPGDRIVYKYLSKSAGDHPRVDDVIAAIPNIARTRAAAAR